MRRSALVSVFALGAAAAIAHRLVDAPRSPSRAEPAPRARSAPRGQPPAQPAAATRASAQPSPVAPHHVVIISEDGLRPDVLTEELAPRHVQLMREGASARRAETIPESDTLPSHASMLSGVGVATHGLWWNSLHAERGFIHVPTVFSDAHEHGLTTAMIVGKPKLQHLAIPGTVDHFERPAYLCGGVARRAAAYFAAATPNLLFVHFSDPDEYGHSHGWMSPEYLRAVRNSDRCLAVVLAAIDASAVADDTLVIVTADHGGHGTRHSGGVAQVDRDIPWIERGPGITRGVAIDETVDTFDTAATALAALGLPELPHMKGRAHLSAVR